MKMQAKIKKSKKVSIVKFSTLTLVTAMLLGSLGGCAVQNKQSVSERGVKVEDEVFKYRTLDELRKVKLPTYTDTFKDSDGVRRKYQVAYEQDVLDLSREFSYAIKDYFKLCGASNWTNEDNEQFWPNDIEYMVTAMAFRESTYRTNVSNTNGCSGLTGLNKETTLKTLNDQWLVENIWGNTIPQVNCNANEVDMFNPTTSIEYTYYNIGYNLSNRFKKDKYFTDIDGKSKTIWTTLDYSEDMQNRLIIASHLFGMTNVIDSIYDRNYYEDDNGQKHKIPLSEYIYSDYVEDVLDKMYELKNTYEQGLGY